MYPKKYDVIVVGAGHAGSEAALAAARMGAKTLCCTINMDSVALMPCNPSIGGPAKAQLCREVDALGGEMGKMIDKTHIHARMLNTGKGPAVQAMRAQADKKKYQFGMKWVMENTDNLDLKQETVTEIVVNNGKAVGVKTVTGWEYRAGAVILTTGTFLRGLIHIGEFTCPAGRAGEFPSQHLSSSLKSLGLELGRLKTGTVPRVDRRTIDFSAATPQYPDNRPLNFSFITPRVVKPGQVPCYLTYTTEKTRDIILKNMHRSPLHGDHKKIKGTGPRYCPSIEDKILRFPDKKTHQVFLEPEGLNTLEVYVQGLSTSLPIDVQQAYIKTVIGMENAEIMRPGYAIEYDYVPPTQLHPWLETRKVENLFLAGQINGTSGYEEAAGQGIIAGINAVLKLDNKDPLILRRDQGYIGVLIDDLVTLGTREPYRMFSSRCEYRLTMRQDNADRRLTPIGYRVGLIDERRYRVFLRKVENVDREIDRLKKRRVKGAEAEDFSEKLKTNISPGVSFYDLLKRPEIKYEDLVRIDPDAPVITDQGPEQILEHGQYSKSITGRVLQILDEYTPLLSQSPRSLSVEEAEEVEIKVKYAGYIKRQEEQIEKFLKMEEILIPQDLDYDQLTSLRNESREKLKKIKPRSIGQAMRISGVNPSDISVILIHLKKSSVMI